MMKTLPTIASSAAASVLPNSDRFKSVERAAVTGKRAG